MHIGNKPKIGERPFLNKWYYGIEILRYPKCMWGKGFYKPSITVYLVKWLQLGEYWKINGEEEKKIGGWKTFTSRYSLTIDFRKE